MSRRMSSAFLVKSDPHPGGNSHLVADWWGREIWLGKPQRPSEKVACESELIWPIVGPPEFMKLVKEHNLGTFACAHQLGEFLE